MAKKRARQPGGARARQPKQGRGRPLGQPLRPIETASDPVTAIFVEEARRTKDRPIVRARRVYHRLEGELGMGKGDIVRHMETLRRFKQAQHDASQRTMPVRERSFFRAWDQLREQWEF